MTAQRRLPPRAAAPTRVVACVWVKRYMTDTISSQISVGFHSAIDTATAYHYDGRRFAAAYWNFFLNFNVFFLIFFLVRSLWSIESQTCSEACNPSRQARSAECSENLQNLTESCGNQIARAASWGPGGSTSYNVVSGWATQSGASAADCHYSSQMYGAIVMTRWEVAVQ